MSRKHRLTHPTLGPATWGEIQREANKRRKGPPKKRICSWCFRVIHIKGLRTRCGNPTCEIHIDSVISWSRVRRRIMRRDYRRCQLCMEPAHEVDHIVPVCLGGTGDDENLRALCKRCHSKETARLAREGSKFRATL